jgi:hypothetical protein
MGSVYLAHDTELDRQVALKVPQFAPEDGPEALERFKHEARAAATLDHQNLCRVYDVGDIDGTYYLTMAYIEGTSLDKAVSRSAQMSPRTIALLMAKLARALKTAHAKNVIHRDLKPSNIMMRIAEGAAEPVIVDFGLARRLDVGDARLTQSGHVVGTWQYMTPEQLCGDRTALGPSCDIYALGVILYELLTGRLPFEAPGQVVVMDPVPPSKYRSDLDPRLEAICSKAMAREPSARYATMGDLAAALADYVRSAQATGTYSRPPESAVVASPPRKLPETRAEPAAIAAEGGRPVPPIAIAGAALAVLSLGALAASWFALGARREGVTAPPPTLRATQAESSAPPPAGVIPAGTESLFDDAWKAIRAEQMPKARALLGRYLADSTAAHKERAQQVLDDLDLATSVSKARNRARGLGESELLAYLDRGVKDLTQVMSTPELREVYAETLIDAFRHESDERSKRATAAGGRDTKDRSRNIGGNPPGGDGDGRGRLATGPRPLTKAAGPGAGRAAPRLPTPVGALLPPDRPLEPGFKRLYDERGLEGWTWKVSIPPETARALKPGTVVPPGQNVVLHRPMKRELLPVQPAGKGFASTGLHATFETEKQHTMSSLRFDYRVLNARPLPRAAAGRKQASAARTAAVEAFCVLHLDKVASLSAQNHVETIKFSLAPADAGSGATLGRPHASQLPRTTDALRPGGEWNEVEVRCDNGSVQLFLNQTPVNHLQLGRKITARIGFEFNGSRLEFANVRLREQQSSIVGAR